MSDGSAPLALCRTSARYAEADAFYCFVELLSEFRWGRRGAVAGQLEGRGRAAGGPLESAGLCGPRSWAP